MGLKEAAEFVSHRFENGVEGFDGVCGVEVLLYVFGKVEKGEIVLGVGSDGRDERGIVVLKSVENSIEFSECLIEGMIQFYAFEFFDEDLGVRASHIAKYVSLKMDQA